MKRETTCRTRAQRPPKRHLRHLLGVLLVITLIIAQTGCAANEKTNDNQGISKTGFYLDTICTITIFGIEDADGSFAAADEEEQQRQLYQLITDAFKLCDSYEKILSKTIKTSDIARVNAASGKAVEVSDATIEVLRKGIEYGRLSNGAFDITIGKATDLWNFHDAGDTALAAEGSGESAADEAVEGEVAAGEAMPGEIPNAQVLAEAMRHVDYSKVEIDGNTVRLADPKMELDLGGIAKGYIADRVTAFLEEKGVRSAIIDLGGNIVALGGKARSMLDTAAGETDFRIGIKDPQSESGALLGTLPASNLTVVTSGTYERYFIADGKKYHHILDSETGYPTDTDVLSATIIAAKGRSVDCDGLSTTCLALGIENALALVNSIEGVEAILVDTNGKVHQTSEALNFTKA